MHNANIPVFEIFNSESCLGRLVNMCIVPRVISVFICNMSGERGGGGGVPGRMWEESAYSGRLTNGSEAISLVVDMVAVRGTQLFQIALYLL